MVQLKSRDLLRYQFVMMTYIQLEGPFQCMKSRLVLIQIFTGRDGYTFGGYYIVTFWIATFLISNISLDYLVQIILFVCKFLCNFFISYFLWWQYWFLGCWRSHEERTGSLQRGWNNCKVTDADAVLPGIWGNCTRDRCPRILPHGWRWLPWPQGAYFHHQPHKRAH